MPGLIGISKESNNIKELINARDSLKYYNWYVDDNIFEDEFLCATRTHLNVLGERHSPSYKAGIYCWIEGEMYNRIEVCNQNKLKSETFALLLIDAYKNNLLDKVCAQIDGYFAGVIYDQKARTIHLISDRYGLKPIFIWKDNQNFAWASELKAFLSFSSFLPKIRKNALSCFMDLGHMMGDITWFENVEMLSASTILSYNLNNKTMKKKRYWTWEQIKPQNINFEEASKKLGRLLKKAVNKRIKPGEKIGISLSGGLDSRSIIASIDTKAQAITAYTFGKSECQDVVIAKQVTKLKGCSHKIFNLNFENWLDGRFTGVWKTDGMLSLLHMHASDTHKEVKKNTDINLNGFAGDLVCGASWIINYGKRISKNTAESKFSKHISLDHIEQSFFNIENEDPYYLNNRVRRFTNLGTEEVSKTIEQRKPFMDNDLIEFMYSLPDEYRFQSKLYNNSLLKAFPEFFNNIPWQQTGIPINRKLTIFHKGKKILKNIISKTGLYNNPENYTDYPNWIRETKTAKLLSKILDPKIALYPRYTTEDFNKKYLKPHLDKKLDYSEQICRALTVEVWLQQIFNNSYK